MEIKVLEKMISLDQISFLVKKKMFHRLIIIAHILGFADESRALSSS